MPTAPSIDTVLVKTASRCNLDCSYCYVYHMADDGWRSQPKRLSEESIDRIVDGLAGLARVQEVPFSVVLHGGEPLLLGRERITRLLTALRERLGPRYGLHVQTNGLLLDSAYLDLFDANDVGVSISFDGPVAVHDANRFDRRGAGSHGRVAAAIERVRSHPGGTRMLTGVLAVVDPTSDPVEVYEALKATGAPGFDLLYRDGNHDDRPPGKEGFETTEYGAWMCRMLDHYLADPNPPRIRLLDDLMRLVMGAPGNKEGVGVTDFGIIVIETDATVTKNDTLKVAHRGADRFSSPQSLHDRSLVDIVEGWEFEEYQALQRPTAEICLSCPELSVCGAGMPAHRWSAERDYHNPTIYCEDQKLLIAHIRHHIAAFQAAA
jgi:uncharacterized protein